MASKEFWRAVFGLTADIAEREKKKAVDSDDYVTAVVAAVFEGVFKDFRATIE
ncbi:MAG: hypothetical protein WC325_07190 [Candidatus Bathyarchaeia archaeon]|jgi:histone H3/H4